MGLCLLHSDTASPCWRTYSLQPLTATTYAGRGGVELDPTQIATARVNTREVVNIKPGLCLSNFTHIVVW